MYVFSKLKRQKPKPITNHPAYPDSTSEEIQRKLDKYNPAAFQGIYANNNPLITNKKEAKKLLEKKIDELERKLLELSSHLSEKNHK